MSNNKIGKKKQLKGKTHKGLDRLTDDKLGQVKSDTEEENKTIKKRTHTHYHNHDLSDHDHV